MGKTLLSWPQGLMGPTHKLRGNCQFVTVALDDLLVKSRQMDPSSGVSHCHVRAWKILSFYNFLIFFNPHRNGNWYNVYCFEPNYTASVWLSKMCVALVEKTLDFKNICPWFRFWLWWILTVNRYQRIISQANIWYTSSSGGPRTIANIWYTAPGLLLSQLSTMFCHQDIEEYIFFYFIFLCESIKPNVYCLRTNANVLAQSF